jgi:DNA transformation protein
MAVSESFLTFVLEQLAGVRAVSSRRMFGGVGIYSGEWFFAVIDNDTLFFKVDDATVGAYRKRRMRPFRPMPDLPPMMGYYQVPLTILEDAEALAAWARDAVEVAKRSKGPKSKRAAVKRTSA